MELQVSNNIFFNQFFIEALQELQQFLSEWKQEYNNGKYLKIDQEKITLVENNEAKTETSIDKILECSFTSPPEFDLFNEFINCEDWDILHQTTTMNPEPKPVNLDEDDNELWNNEFNIEESSVNKPREGRSTLEDKIEATSSSLNEDDSPFVKITRDLNRNSEVNDIPSCPFTGNDEMDTFNKIITAYIKIKKNNLKRIPRLEILYYLGKLFVDNNHDNRLITKFNRILLEKFKKSGTSRLRIQATRIYTLFYKYGLNKLYNSVEVYITDFGKLTPEQFEQLRN